MNHEVYNDRAFGEILSDTREELKQFLETRIAMLRSEMSEKAKIIKTAAPIAAIGALFLATAFLLFSLALVGVVEAFFQTNPFRWAIAFCAVAVLWSIIGAIAAFVAKRGFRSHELIPNRTIGVLKQDKLWIQAEVKSQI